MSAPIIFPQPVILNLSGSGLNEGHVYIGVPGEDPVTNPQAVYWDEDLTIPATQPLDVLGGYIMYLSSPAFAYTSGSYSFAAYAKDNTLVYQDLVVVPSGVTGEDFDFVVTWTGPQTTATAWLGGEKMTRPVVFPANFSGSQGRSPITNPAATYTVTFKKNGSTIGTAVSTTGGVWTFASSGGTSYSFAVGDVIDAYGSGDTTIANFALSLSGSVAT
jgi:hypothetical protein